MTWSIPAEREGRAPDLSLIERRRQAAAMMSAPVTVEGVQISEQEIGGRSCTICDVEDPLASVVYLHGGGYRLGEARSWAGFCAPLALATRSRFVLVDYRLAPEHPFPAALSDSAAVYGSIISEGDGPVFVSGDSAGGGLAAAVALAARSTEHVTPRGVILISPWLDLTLSAPSFVTNADSDQFFPLDSARVAVESYLADSDPFEPLASPLFGDLSEFPPTLMMAGGAETLLDDALRFRDRLEDEGVDVTGYFPPAMQHVWPTLFPDLPESRVAREAIVEFVDRLAR
jgi:acetyl esterase/lipase